MTQLIQEVLAPVEKFVKKELKDNCALWDAEPEKFTARSLSQIEGKLGILQLPEVFPDEFPEVSAEIIKTLSSGCGAIGFIYSIHFSINALLKTLNKTTTSELTISPVILGENDWLFYFEKENKFSGRLGGIIGGDIGKIFFLPITKSDETKGWVLVEGRLSYSEETTFLPGLRAISTGNVDFEKFKMTKEILYISEGEWFEIFKSWFLYYQLSIITGLIKNAYEIAIDYASQRKQGGKLIIEIPSVKRLLTQVETTLTVMEAITNNFTFEKSDWIKHVRHFYLNTIDSAEKAILNSIQAMGGYGYMQDYKVERILRDFRSIRSIFSPLEYI